MGDCHTVLFIVLRKGFRELAGILENGTTTVALIQALVSGMYVTALAPLIFQNLHLADKGKSADG